MEKSLPARGFFPPFFRVCALTVLIAYLVFGAAARANVDTVLPDFYKEPGLNPFRDNISANEVEHIDPFSGSLNLSHVDLVLPGNGGMDIVIQRTYTSNVYQTNPSQTSSAPWPGTLQPRKYYRARLVDPFRPGDPRKI